MKKATKSGLRIFIILLAIIVLVSIFTVIKGEKRSKIKINTNNNSDIELDTEYNKNSKKEFKNEYVAALYIQGVIQQQNQDYNQKWILSTIKNLKNDTRNQGLVVFINSPGGAVYQSDEVYLALENYKTSGKKVYIYQGPLAASGGYYISCAGNQIWANRNTLTGSIGVISGQTFDLTEFLKEHGIKSVTIHAGKNKNMGNYNEPFTEEQQAIMQSIADECYEQFTGIVAKSRNISIEQVQELADGRIYTAKQALELNLIDKIDSWENCLKYFTETELEKPGIKIETYKKERKTTFKEYLTGTVSNIYTSQIAAKLGLPVKIVEEMNGYNDYPAYLYK